MIKSILEEFRQDLSPSKQVLFNASAFLIWLISLMGCIYLNLPLLIVIFMVVPLGFLMSVVISDPYDEATEIRSSEPGLCCKETKDAGSYYCICGRSIEY